MDVRRERRDQDSASPQREQRAERLTYETLRPGRAGPLGVRRVTEQEVDSAVPYLRELAHVGLEPVDRRVVELPVARVHDPAGSGLDHERDRVGDRVRHPHQLDAERAELERGRLGVSLDELCRLRKAVLVELRLDQAERETRRDDGLDLDLAQEVREAANVILVAVRQDDGPHAAPFEVADVREQQVDAEVLVPRERQTGVDDEQLSAGLVHGHVLADLAEAAERNDSQCVAHATECMRGRESVLGGLRGGGLKQPEPLEAAAYRLALVVRSPRRAGDVARRRRAPAGSART